MIAILIICFFFLLLTAAPIIFALLGSSITTFYFFQPRDLKVISQILFSANESFALLAIPLFILSGALMSGGGISKRLVNFFETLVGYLPGGLAVVAVVACAFFGALSGSAPATVAAIAGIMIPSMVEKKYDKAWTACLLASSGTLGAIIPPSIPMVLYGVLSGTSVTTLFSAGIVPGIMIALCYCIYCVLYCKKRGIKGTRKYTLREIGKSFIDAIWALLMPVIILGGIYSGLFTPTEAATVSVVYAIIIGLFVYKELKLKEIPKIFWGAAKASGGILMIITCAATFATILTRNNIPTIIGNKIISVASTPLMFYLLFSVFMFILGMFMSVSPALVILTPILAPAVKALGIDPVHFGVVFVIWMCIGTVTPPFGTDLFIACGV
ncbi:MAG TPA: TRAP transporter large permease, partial [Clostridiales bacterium]|nr:TRAP transporter large permease [Clostridiales bacterium]